MDRDEPFSQEEVQFLISRIRGAVKVVGQTSVSEYELITLHLRNGITVTLDIDIAYCRIHRNWNLLCALEYDHNDISMYTESLISLLVNPKFFNIT